jgi:hypothetical protein
MRAAILAISFKSAIASAPFPALIVKVRMRVIIESLPGRNRTCSVVCSPARTNAVRLGLRSEWYLSRASLAQIAIIFFVKPYINASEFAGLFGQPKQPCAAHKLLFESRGISPVCKYTYLKMWLQLKEPTDIRCRL